MLADDPGKRLLARCRQGGESRSEPQPHETSKRHSTAARTRSKTAPRSTELEPSFWDPQGSDARYLLPGGTSNAASAAIAALPIATIASGIVVALSIALSTNTPMTTKTALRPSAPTTIR